MASESISLKNEEIVDSDEENISSPDGVPLKKTSMTSSEGILRHQYLFFFLSLSFLFGSNVVFSFCAHCVRHGGLIFLGQLLFCLFVVGCPLILLELLVAQFSSLGPFLLFRRAVPIFGGISSALAFILVIRSCTQSVWLAYTVSFAGMSFDALRMPSEMPWDSCRMMSVSCFDHMKSEKCLSSSSKHYATECLPLYRSLANSRFTNQRATPFLSFADTNLFKSVSVPSDLSFPSYIFTLSLIGVWTTILIFAPLTDFWLKFAAPATVPIVVIYYVIQMIIGFQLENAIDGLEFLIRPDWSKLYSVEAWSDALSTAVLSLGVASGVLLQLASLRSFERPLRRDSLFLVISIIFFYAVVCLTIFLHLGHLSNVVFPDVPHNNRLNMLADDRLHFVQFVITEVITSFPLGWLWCFIHFFVEFVRVWMSTMVIAWTLLCFSRDRLVSFCSDESWSYFRRLLYSASFIISGLLCSFPFLLPGGGIQLLVMENFTDIVALSLALLQIICFAYIYGIMRLKVNLSTMSASWRFIDYIFCICWLVLCPLTISGSVLMSVVSSILTKTPLPQTLSAIGWFLVVLALSFPCFYGLIKVTECIRKKELWDALRRTDPCWGPLLDEDREKAVKKERATRVR